MAAARNVLVYVDFDILAINVEPLEQEMWSFV
jgi:hypothetical protein